MSADRPPRNVPAVSSFIGWCGGDPAPEVEAALRRHLGLRGPGPVEEQVLGDVTLRISGGDGCAAWDPAGLLVVLDGEPSVDGEGRPLDAAGVLRRYRFLGERGVTGLDGSFAVVVVDRRGGEEPRTLLARSRWGHKPLFWARTPSGFAWSSSAMALGALAGSFELDVSGLSQVWYYRWLVGRESLFRAVPQVPPATVVHRVSGSGAGVRHQRGWELEEAASGDGLDVEAWADRVEEAFDDWAGRTLSGRRVAVPLSGGVDSSLIAIYALRHAAECFLVTGDWPDEANPELERARTVADRLGAPLHTALVPPERVAERFPELVRTMEQPLRNYHMFALDAVVEESAALGADLVLHGEAADTLFGSHSLNFVARFSRKRRWLEWLPRPVLTAASRLLPDLHPRLRRLRRLCREDARAALLRYHRIRARADTGRLLGVRSDAPAAEVESRLEGHSEKDTVRQKEVLLYSNAVSHLEMVDRLATPHGMHVLMPYMDSPVLELGLALPPSFHIRDGHVKPVLRTLAARYLDRDFVFTPKMGFPTPFRAWLAGPLAPRVEALADPASHVARAFGRRVARGPRFPEDYETIWNLMCLEELLAYAEELAAEPGEG